MTQVHTVPAVTAALIAQGTVTVITATERGIDGRVLIRADVDATGLYSLPSDDGTGRIHKDRGGTVHVINPGCIVASATVEWVPITDENDCPLNSRHAHLGVWMMDQPRRLYLFGPNIKTYGGLDLTDQVTHGDFTPGRWAGILADVQPTTKRCPAHWDEPRGMNSVACWACPGMVSPDRTCPPIPCDNVKEWP